MKSKLFTILIIILLTSQNFSQNSAFTVVNTRVMPRGANYTIFTSFLNSSVTGEGKYFVGLESPISNPVVVMAGRINDFGTMVYAYARVTPLSGEQIANSNVTFSGWYQVAANSGDAAQVGISFKVVYTLQNTSGSPATLYYAINPRIAYVWWGGVATRNAQIGLYKSNSEGSNLTALYESNTLNGHLFTRARGIVETNVPAGAQRSITLDVFVEQASQFNSLNYFDIDAVGGVDIGFTGTAISPTNSLGNNPNLPEGSPLRFNLYNWNASNFTGPAMGTTGANAFRNLDWHNSYSAAVAVSEDLAFIEGTDGITLKLTGFSLGGFKMNSNLQGSQSDSRRYVNGTAEIYQNGVLKLKLIKCRFDANIPYPVPFGTGGAILGKGWGEIDNANSDDTWEAAFNSNGTNQVDFAFHSVDNVTGNQLFSAEISIIPTAVSERIASADIGNTGGTVDFGDGIAVDLTIYPPAIEGSFEDAKAVARQIQGNPGGALPEGIERLSTNVYWEIGTTATTFTANVAFDLSSVPGIEDLTKIRILKRNDSSTEWAILDPSNYSINGNVITVNNITSFSEFGIGSTGNNPLPVELEKFSAIQRNEDVELVWVTATEINNYGFEIERRCDDNEWLNIGFVAGAGNSNSTKNYIFIDKKLSGNNLIYRLKQIDIDGTINYSNEINVSFNNIPEGFSLLQNYPNPFNPSTNIEFCLAANSNVKLELFNIMGEKIATLIDSEMKAGRHNYQFSTNQLGNNQLSSGLYLYKLTAGNQTFVRKMSLVK